jgi:MoaA/NifB/PqqE/SkfB family radical SAM enzyme
VFHDVAGVVIPKYFAPDDVEIIGVGEDRPNPNAAFRYHVVRRLENVKLTSRGGTAPNKMVPDPVPRGFCQYPWTQFIVSADGRVPMCCCDLNITQPVGDISRQSVMEVWHGEPLRRIREGLWRGDRQPTSTCRQCDFYGVKEAPNTAIGRLVYAITL